MSAVPVLDADVALPDGLADPRLLRRQSYIGGHWIDAETRIAVRDPASMRSVATTAALDPARMDDAIDAASEAFPGWRGRLPQERAIRLDNEEPSGWVVRLPGLRFPVVCDVTTGLVGYHRRDNAYQPYACLMRFLHTVYAIQARLKRNGSKERHPAPAQEAI